MTFDLDLFFDKIKNVKYCMPVIILQKSNNKFQKCEQYVSNALLSKGIKGIK